jgi:hypothetical protein
MNEIIEGTRNKNLTGLLAALHHDAAVLYVPRHVLVEVERDLPRNAVDRLKPVNPDDAMARWRTLYAQRTRVVDVPDHWGADDERVQAVVQRHSNDASLARLAVALADCWVLAEDPDLTENGFGHYDRLPMLLAAANEGELNFVQGAAAIPLVLGEVLISGVVHGFGRLPWYAQRGIVVASGFLVYQWHHSGRLGGGLKQVFTTITNLAELAAPPLELIFTRLADGQEIWQERRLTRATEPDLSERVARILAFAPEEGLLAGDVARELEGPGSLKDRTTLVRQILAGCPAFVEIRRGRWLLGHAVSDERVALPPTMVSDWLQRAHRAR